MGLKFLLNLKIDFLPKSNANVGAKSLMGIGNLSKSMVKIESAKLEPFL